MPKRRFWRSLSYTVHEITSADRETMWTLAALIGRRTEKLERTVGGSAAWGRFLINFVRTLTERQGQQVGSPDEVAFQMGWIDEGQLRKRAIQFGKNGYGDYLSQISSLK